MPSIAHRAVTNIFDFLDSVLGKPTDDRPIEESSQTIKPALLHSQFDKPPIAGQLRPSAPVDESPRLKYYPSNKHILKGQAPEQNLSENDLRSLVSAQKLAVSKGILSPELGAKLLPIAMVEGHSGNYGVVSGIGIHPSKKNIAKFKAMGFSIEDVRNNTKPHEVKADLEIRKVMGEKGKVVDAIMEGALSGPEAMAKLAATMLSVKADLKGISSPEDAVERYNGKGKALEYADGRLVPADSKKYVNKVQEALSLLQHPANAKLKERYLQLLDER